MGDHNRRNAGFDQMLVRIEFDRVEALAGMWDDRQGMVRIGIGISMPRKVFDDGKHVLDSKSHKHIRSLLGNLLRVFAERTHSDDRVPGIAIDIYYRGEVYVNP